MQTTETAVAVTSELVKVTDQFVHAFTAVAGAADTAVYLVGSPALGDTSARQSNVDVVAVSRVPLTASQLAETVRWHGSLRRNGRDGVVAYATWAGLSGRPEAAEASVYVGSRPVEADRLVNPMTWAIMATRPCLLHGEGQERVFSEPAEVRAWFAGRLPALVDRTAGLLWRRHLSRIVLQSTRAAHGALTGEVLSLREAGERARAGASHTSNRVITDALGYRAGSNTSMYWGPFERKSNAETLARAWLRQVQAATE
ncbi:MAG TPA: hypothetical protein VG435_16255 [Acidimicrobiales bacterium]|jgi:hypothetical protein|nr:hypothetical protein [Acidimicrobiales bacterium]